MDRKAKIIDDLKMFYGLPPYEGGGNICRGDGYFVNSIEKKYGKSFEELKTEVGWTAVAAEWSRLVNQFKDKHHV